MPASEVENNLRLPTLIVAFQSQIVKRHGFYFREDRVVGRINSFAVDLGKSHSSPISTIANFPNSRCSVTWR